MRKAKSKMSLSKETLRHLENEALRNASGGLSRAVCGSGPCGTTDLTSCQMNSITDCNIRCQISYNPAITCAV